MHKLRSESSFPTQHWEECVRGIGSMQLLFISRIYVAVLLLFNRSHVVSEAAVLIFHTYFCCPVNTLLVNVSEMAPVLQL